MRFGQGLFRFGEKLLVDQDFEEVDLVSWIMRSDLQCLAGVLQRLFSTSDAGRPFRGLGVELTEWNQRLNHIKATLEGFRE